MIAEVIKKKLEKELGFAEDFVNLIETTSEKALDVQLSTIKVLKKTDKSIILLSTTRPCSNLMTLLKKNSIDLNKIIIFDITGQKQTNPELNEKKNVLHFYSTELTNISIGINQLINEKNSKKCILIDSITTMCVNNNPNIFARFIHSLLTKIRINKASGILISFEKEGNPIIEEIAQMCDKIIKV